MIELEILSWHSRLATEILRRHAVGSRSHLGMAQELDANRQGQSIQNRVRRIAKHCRTSVEMIEKRYAAHFKDMIYTSLVNVRRERPKRNDEATEGHSGNRPEARLDPSAPAR